MTGAGIVAQWQAYAEVYGTNGMAAGGGRSSLVEAAAEQSDDAEPEVADSDAAPTTAEAAAEPAEASSVDGTSDSPCTERTTGVPEAPQPAREVRADAPPERLAIWDF